MRTWTETFAITKTLLNKISHILAANSIDHRFSLNTNFRTLRMLNSQKRIAKCVSVYWPSLNGIKCWKRKRRKKNTREKWSTLRFDALQQFCVIYTKDSNQFTNYTPYLFKIPLNYWCSSKRKQKKPLFESHYSHRSISFH